MADAKAPAPAGAATAEADPGPIPFNDLAAQRRRLGPALDDALARVFAHGRYILGPEVGALETHLATLTGQRHAVTCSSGTDALALVLMAWEIGPGDAVFVPGFTFAASAEGVAWVGATPVFCDVREDTFNLDAASLEAAIQDARGAGLRPKAVVPVDLFGQAADYERIEPIARANGLQVLCDAAQSFGAALHGRRVGGFGDATALSFFPSKPLGCYGDGGAVLTADEETAATIRSLRVHGAGRDEYENVRIGRNARLDTVQAAILLAKLEIFEDEIAARQRVATRYDQALKRLVDIPGSIAGANSVWAQYTIHLNARDTVAARVGADGIPSAVYYPVPLNRQPAYRDYPSAPGGTPVADRLAARVLSLPMHAYLDEATQDRIVKAIQDALAG